MSKLITLCDGWSFGDEASLPSGCSPWRPVGWDDFSAFNRPIASPRDLASWIDHVLDQEVGHHGPDLQVAFGLTSAVARTWDLLDALTRLLPTASPPVRLLGFDTLAGTQLYYTSEVRRALADLRHWCDVEAARQQYLDEAASQFWATRDEVAGILGRHPSWVSRLRGQLESRGEGKALRFEPTSVFRLLRSRSAER